jgi:hypothetical protein
MGMKSGAIDQKLDLNFLQRAIHSSLSGLAFQAAA